MTQIFTDDDIRTRLSAGDAVTWIREAVLLHSSGRLVAPARLSAPLGDGRMVMTAGRTPGLWYGYRAYDTREVSAGQQVVVAHDDHTGDVMAIAVGNELGPRRTGALGGVAAALMTADDAPVSVALVGTGTQAWTQLWAISAAIDVERVRVFSRRPASRQAFSDRVSTELALPAVATDSARDAVRDADVVVLATSSPEPVIDSAWLADDVLVTTMGPKQLGRAEFSPDLVTGAAQVVTDSLPQLQGYDPPTVASTLTDVEVIELGDLAAGAHGALTSGRRVYLSVGLAGTEVHLLGRLAQQAGGQPVSA